MKTFLRLLALLTFVALCMSFVACGDDEEPAEETGETRYTITEDEWKEFVKGYDNVTEKVEIYCGDEESYSYVWKRANGIVCWCENEKNNDPDSDTATGTMTTVPSTPGSGTIDLNPSTGSSNGGTADVRPSTGSSYGSSNDVWLEGGTNTIVFGGNGFNTNRVSFNGGNLDLDLNVTVRTEFFASSLLGVIIDDFYPIGTGGWVGDDFIQLIYQLGTYKDSDGNTYSFNTTIDIGTGCVKTYKGKEYYELRVKDEDGNIVNKWVEKVDTHYNEEIEINEVKFKQLKYDEKEKAYVFHKVYEEHGFATKMYLYFENGKLVKSISFQSYESHDHVGEEAGEIYDISKVTPKKGLISDNYTTVVSTYKKHGETKIKNHPFSADDIISKVE